MQSCYTENFYTKGMHEEAVSPRDTAHAQALSALEKQTHDEKDAKQKAELRAKDEDTIEIILAQIDMSVQYHDDVEPQTRDENEDAGNGDLNTPAWAREAFGGVMDGGDGMKGANHVA